MPRNISPTTAQRAALGSVVKMIQDPLNYKQLLLFGTQGCLICADHTVASPKWRSVNLAVSAGTAVDITVVAGTASTLRPTFGQTFTITSVFHSSFGGFYNFEFTLPACYNVTWISGALTARVQDSVIMQWDNCGGPTYHAGIDDGNPFTDTAGLAAANTHIGEMNSASRMYSQHGSQTTFVLKISGGASDVTYFGDMVGSINKKGWFGWLGQDGTDVWFYYTSNYFQTRKRVNVGAYDSNKVYTISVGSYGNNTTKGVVLVTAGTSVYKSTNYGVSFSDLSFVVNDSGGPIVVPFAKNGGAVNAGTSPQYLLVKGVSTNLQARSLAGSTVTLASGSSHVPFGPYSLNVFNQDGAYCWCIMSDGTFYTSVDGGGTWSAQATPTHTGTVYGASGSPKNLAFVLAFGNECLAYSADSGAAWTSLYSSYRTWADAYIGSGKAQTIVTALVDLALLYSKPVSQ